MSSTTLKSTPDQLGQDLVGSGPGNNSLFKDPQGDTLLDTPGNAPPVNEEDPTRPIRQAALDAIANAPKGAFATRRQSLDRLARGAGVVRSGSDTDLLGFPKVRPRNVSRTLLGD